MTDSDAQITSQTPKIRHDWYQTESHVIINILWKKVNPDDFKAKYEDDSVSANFSCNFSNFFKIKIE